MDDEHPHPSMIRIQSLPKKGGFRKTPGTKTPKTEVDGSDDFSFERLGDFKVNQPLISQGCIGIDAAFKDFWEFSFDS